MYSLNLVLYLTLVAWVPRAVILPEPKSRALATSNLGVPRYPLVPRLTSQCVWSAGDQEWVCDLDVPTLQQFVETMRDSSNEGKATAANSVWFYSNLNDKWFSSSDVTAMNLAWLSKNGISSYSVFDSVSQQWLNTQKDIVNANAGIMSQEGNSKDPYNDMVKCYNQALAFAAISPDAYLFTRKDTEPGPNSFWVQIESWALTHNPNIQRIWRIDARPDQGGPCAVKTLIWNRATDKPCGMYDGHVQSHSRLRMLHLADEWRVADRSRHLDRVRRHWMMRR